MKRPPHALVAAVALSLSVLVAGCSSGDDDDDKRGPGKDTPARLDGDWSVRGALAEVPMSATGDRVFVQTGDLAAAVEAAGLERTDGGDVLDWLPPVTGVGRDGTTSQVFVPLADLVNPTRAGEDRLKAVLGFDLDAVDSFVNQSTPPNDFVVVSGADLSPDLLSDDLVDQDGVLTDVEGEDLAINPQQLDDALSPLGRPTRIRAEEGAVVLSSTTPAVKDWRGDGETLADNESLAAVASALDDAGVYSAVVTEAVSGSDPAAEVLGPNVTPEQLEAVRKQIEGTIPQQPYDAVGIGWAVEDGEARVHVAYHFADDDAASSGLETLEQAWSEGMAVQSRRPMSDYVTVADSATDGPVATITLSMVDQGPPATVLNFLAQQEPVFVSR